MRFLKPVLLLGTVALVAACSSKTFMKRGDAYFQTERYSLASQMYEKAYKKAKDRDIKADAANKVGFSLDQVNQPRKAASWYRRALQSRDTFSDAVFSLAHAELKNQKLEEAEENFMEYQDLKPDSQKAEQGFNTLKRIQDWNANPTRYKVQPMKLLNSGASDFGAAYMGQDTNVILFASTRGGKSKLRVDPITGDGYSNIYEVYYSNEIKRESKKKKGKARIIQTDTYKWSRPNKLGDTINSRFHEGGISFNAEGDLMLFSSSKKLGTNNLGSKIYSARNIGDSWGDVMLLDIAADSLSVGHPSLSSDGERLYFASDMPGGLGGKDIWMVKKEGNGWGEPVNLGKQINTPGNEMFPFIREDGVLYFSSDTHPGMGGLDIFKAIQDEMGRWTVENMQYPINSSADDFGIVFQAGKEKGMFTSSRNRGDDDIYRFDLMPVVFAYNGEVKHAATNEPLAGVKIQVISSQGVQEDLKSDGKGRFNLILEPATEYILVASNEGFLNDKDQVSTVDLDESHTFSGKFNLKPIEKPIELPNIFYDFARWELREESKTALDGLVGTLNDNPNITIELGSHTDMVGSVASNQELSQKRAQSVVDYLIDKGVFWDRLNAKGYGESQPKKVDEELAGKYDFLNEGDVLDEPFLNKLNPEQQQIANQINRRTEFRVLSTDYKPGPNSKRRPGATNNQMGNTVIKDLKDVKGVFYTVQIGVFQKQNVPDAIQLFQVVFRDEVDRNSYRYTTGIFDQYEEAKAEAQNISRKGIKAFVVAYNNGKKITFEEAKKLKQ